MKEMIYDDYIEDFEEEEVKKPIGENLESYIEDAKNIAIDLRYPQECLDSLDKCKSIIAVNNVLAYYRRRIR